LASSGSTERRQEHCAKPKKTAALPDRIRPHPGLFAPQVVGESMNRRIPNGAWRLFRTNPVGTREGKVIVVQTAALRIRTRAGGTPSSAIRARKWSPRKVAGGISESRFGPTRIDPVLRQSR